MKSRMVLALACLFLVVISAHNDDVPKVGPAKGSLVIVGGGKVLPSISNRFIGLAGGRAAKFVYIPTAASDDELYSMKRRCCTKESDKLRMR